MNARESEGKRGYLAKSTGCIITEETIAGIFRLFMESKAVNESEKFMLVKLDENNDSLISNRNGMSILDIKQYCTSGLDNMLYCGTCGRRMYYRKTRKGKMYFICSTYCKKGKSACSSHRVEEEQVYRTLTRELVRILKNENSYEQLTAFLRKELNNEDSCLSALSSLEQQILVKQKQQDILYFDRLEGKISEQLFSRINANIENRISQLRHEIEKFKSRSGEDVDFEGYLAKLLKQMDKNRASCEMIKLFIKSVIVFEAEEINDFEQLEGKGLEDTDYKMVLSIEFKD